MAVLADVGATQCRVGWHMARDVCKAVATTTDEIDCAKFSLMYLIRGSIRAVHLIPIISSGFVGFGWIDTKDFLGLAGVLRSRHPSRLFSERKASLLDFVANHIVNADSHST